MEFCASRQVPEAPCTCIKEVCHFSGDVYLPHISTICFIDVVPPLPGALRRVDGFKGIRRSEVGDTSPSQGNGRGNQVNRTCLNVNNCWCYRSSSPWERPSSRTAVSQTALTLGSAVRVFVPKQHLTTPPNMFDLFRGSAWFL